MARLAGLVLMAGPAFLFAQSPVDRGLQALQDNDWTGAVVAFNQVRESYASDARVWIGLARAHQHLGQPADAQASAARAEALGDTPFIAQGLAIYHAEGNRLDDATRLAGRASANMSSSHNAAFRNLLGKLLFGAGNIEGSVPFLQQATQLNPFEVAYHSDLGQALLRQQRFADVVAAIEPTRKTFSGPAQLELILGVGYYGLRRFPEAVDAFLRVIRASPDVPQPYVFLSRMMNQVHGRAAEVERAFTAYHRRRPDDALAAYLHAVGLVAQLPPTGFPAKAAEAEAILRQSIGIKETADAHAELGSLLERKREFTEAARAFERALVLAPNNSSVSYRLSRVYDRLGQAQKAAVARARHDELVQAERQAMDKHGAAMSPAPILK